MTDVGFVLAQLKKTPADEDTIHRLRVAEESPLDVFIGLERPEGTPILQLELPTSQALPVKDFRTKGLRVEAELVRKKGEKELRYTLTLADRDAEQLFVMVAEDLLQVVAIAPNAKTALSGFMARLRHWSDFFSRNHDGGLTAEEQLGLFGELWVLREMLAPYGTREAVAAWTGPEAANQDFQWRDCALEVKSTAAGPPLSLRISNVKQLDDETMERITVVLVEVDRHRNGGTPLPALIDSVRRWISETDPMSSDEFLHRLSLCGYSDSHAESYADHGYSVRRVSAYVVSDGFPRLLVRDLPQGVGGVKYQVDVSSIAEFEVDVADEMMSFLERRADDRA